jgi:hypothetical protein
LLLTGAGYLALTGYDLLAFRWIGRRLALRRIALASFIAYVFSHNVGLSFLGGSAVRYRMYSSWGVPPADLGPRDRVQLRDAVARLPRARRGAPARGSDQLVRRVARDREHAPARRAVRAASSRPTGCSSSGAGATCAWASSRSRSRAPDQRGADAALGGRLDARGRGVLGALPASSDLGFARFLGIFLLAQVAGLISHVPPDSACSRPRW